MAVDFSYIDHDILGDVADAIRFVEGSTTGIAPVDYPQRIRALDKYIPDYDVLNFYMPNGGTISLNKTGSPTVVELEYWLDENGQWLIWQPDNDGNRSITLSAGQRMYVRNTSETSTLFSLSTNDYYNFKFSETTEAYGNVNSLLCRILDNALLSSRCFFRLLYNNQKLITSPQFPSNELQTYCYYAALAQTKIIVAPYLVATTLKQGCYQSMFSGCDSLIEVRTAMNTIAYDSLYRWLADVSSTGDLYCSAELTIPTGESGIPSGWTRHDLTE